MNWHRRFAIGTLLIWVGLTAGAVGTSAAKTPGPVLRERAESYQPAEDAFASAVVIDTTTGKRLYSYLPEKKWPAASLTKLMNALVLRDQQPNWSKKVAITAKDAVGGGELKLKEGSRMSIQDLLYASIVASANNAATALARTSRTGLAGFIQKMNAKAKTFGLKTTDFVDPSGIDPENVTTAAEMAIIADRAFKDPVIRRAASTATYQIATTHPATKKTLTNTNHLLTRDKDVYVYGGKTGFLYESRYNLAVKLRPIKASASQPPLLVVVMGSPTYSGSFKTAKGLAEWAWKAYKW